MSDIQTGWNPATGTGDWILAPERPSLWTDEGGNLIVDQDGLLINAIIDQSNTLDFVNDLTTAVLISLFTDAAADDDDIIPDGTTNKRGWWGDSTMGSKIWLLSRSKATSAVAGQVVGYAEAALAWLVADQIAASVSASAQWVSSRCLQLTVTITRGNGAAIAIRFSNLWDFV